MNKSRSRYDDKTQVEQQHVVRNIKNGYIFEADNLMSSVEDAVVYNEGTDERTSDGLFSN